MHVWFLEADALLQVSFIQCIAAVIGFCFLSWAVQFHQKKNPFWSKVDLFKWNSLVWQCSRSVQTLIYLQTTGTRTTGKGELIQSPSCVRWRLQALYTVCNSLGDCSVFLADLSAIQSSPFGLAMWRRQNVVQEHICRLLIWLAWSQTPAASSCALFLLLVLMHKLTFFCLHVCRFQCLILFENPSCVLFTAYVVYKAIS